MWRSTPSVNDVALTGADTGNPWPRGPNETGGYQLDARVATLQEQALGAFTNHAQVRNPPPQQMLDDLASFQRILFTNHRVRALSDALRAGTLPLPDPDGPLTALEQAGKAVFVRACTQCHGGPGQSNAAGASHPVPRHLQRVSAPGRHGDPGPLRLDAVSATARAQRADLRDHAAQRHHGTPHELGSRSRAAHRRHRRRAATGRLEQAGHAGAARARQDGAVLPQQQRGDTRSRGRSLHRVLQAGQGDAPAWCSAAGARAPTACTSIGRRRRRSACRCSPT